MVLRLCGYAGQNISTNGCNFRVYRSPNLKTVKKALKARRCLSKLPNVLISGIGMLN